MNDRDFENLRTLYEQDLQLLHNESCRKCDAAVKYPLMPWRIGEKYWDDPLRLVFVGKPHRGGPCGDDKVWGPSQLLDSRSFAQKAFLEPGGMAYWNYTREIARRVFGTEQAGWERLAFTNLVKCTSVATGNLRRRHPHRAGNRGDPVR